MNKRDRKATGRFVHINAMSPNAGTKPQWGLECHLCKKTVSEKTFTLTWVAWKKCVNSHTIDHKITESSRLLEGENKHIIPTRKNFDLTNFKRFLQR